jgi:predicted DNA-binding transcriptional regulator YafY
VLGVTLHRVNKTERLYAIVEELRAVAPQARSASWLAARFEVSVRTIERDLSALQQAGVPIWASNGRRGGYAVDVELTLPPLNFTPSEAAALVAALAMAGPTPLSPAARSGMAKIAAAMSPTSREGAGELARRILVPERVDSDDPVAATVGQALADRRVLEIDYVDAGGAGTFRVIEPTGLVSVENVWFLVAWCRLRDAYRVFRMDRIRTAVPRLETTSDRPPPDPSGKLTTPVRALTV